MPETENGVKWFRNRHGFAIVNLDVSPETENKIIEQFSGKGWFGQGNIDAISKNGFDNWKTAAKRALEYAFTFTDNYYTVTINSIEGLIATDTNATVVGYVTILAFFDKIGYTPEKAFTDNLEEFVLSSWKQTHDATPNFFDFTFTYPANELKNL